MMFLKKTVYEKLVAKVNSIDTSGFVLKTSSDTDKKELEIKFLIKKNRSQYQNHWNRG